MNHRPAPSMALRAIALVLVAGTLSACAPLIIGGAAVGTMVSIDRRTPGTQIDDEGIELRGAARMRDTFGERAHVNITSYNRQVLLTGEVPTEQARQQAEQLVGRIENVRGIFNELVVAGTSNLGQRSNDTLVTAKVKASLVDARDLFVNAFKVVTERGVVYLMGRVTNAEAERATQMTRTIGGVQRVVRLFEVVSEDELRQFPQGPAPAPSSVSMPAPRP